MIARDVTGSPPFFPGLEVLEELAPGAGGMGVVYRAREAALDRVVAVKTVRGDADSPAVREFFMREAPAAAQLDHPNILRIHRFNPEHTPPFFVMQYVDGRPLDQACAGRDYGWTAGVLEKVALALSYAHGRGVVHRDVKPANILVDADGEPHVADFGLAGRLGAPADGEGGTAGTPACLAPEVWPSTTHAGAPPRVSPALDVYGVGVTTYRVLTGRYPFTGQCVEDLRAAVLAGSPPLPQELDPAVPEALQRICLKAMEPDPAHRYESAKAMADDLRRFREGREVFARPTRYRNELRGKLRNHLTDLELWLRQSLIDRRDYDRLARPARTMLEGPYPWHALSRRFPWETILLRIGGWIVVVASILWGAVYWDKLDTPQRIVAEGVPMVVISAVGWGLRARGSRVNALILLSIGALLLPLFVTVVLSEMRWLESWQGAARELFVEGEVYVVDEDERGRPLNVEDHRRRSTTVVSPSNLQATVSVGFFVAYCVVLVAATRSPIMVAWVCVGVYLFHTGVLLRLGLKEWLNTEHVARALAWYLPVPLAFWGAGLLLGRAAARAGSRLPPSYAASVYAFFPLPAVACLSMLAWYGAVEWLGAEPEWNAQWINAWWMVDGLVYFAGAMYASRSRVGFVRFWGPVLMLLVSVHLTVPTHQLFDRGYELFGLGDAAVTTYELLALGVAVALAVLGTWLRLHTLAIPGLLSLAGVLVHASVRHFENELAWPVVLVALGGVMMVVAAALLVWRSGRAREGIM
jgi:hypothetical protein